MDLKKEEEMRMLAETPLDLDPLTLKKLIIKLETLERNLRELRKLKALEMAKQRKEAKRQEQKKFNSKSTHPNPFNLG